MRRMRDEEVRLQIGQDIVTNKAGVPMLAIVTSELEIQVSATEGMIHEDEDILGEGEMLELPDEEIEALERELSENSQPPIG